MSPDMAAALLAFGIAVGGLALYAARLAVLAAKRRHAR